ncbi:MAG: ral secretion pathway protein [Candidatus Sumerlaeota bacterium]|nr:ral secretion pathway protein [Candidatus Sumerlaeota bacterium]
MTTRTTRSLAVTAAALLAMPVALHARRDRADFAEGVQFNEADASPTAAVSNINEYTFQDEQINIDPEDGVVKVLRTDQKILLNDYVTAIIPCHNVHPREIRGPIRTLVRKEGGEADVLQDRETGELYLHVVCPRFQLPFVKSTVAGLDAEWVKERRDGSGELYYKAKFRDIRDIQRISQFYIGPEGVGRFSFDTLNNALYYTDQPALIGLQEWGLSQIDIPPNQVELEVAIYEIDMNNDTLLGLDYVDWKNGPGRNVFEADFFYEKIRNETRTDANGWDTTADSHRKFSYAQLNGIAASQFIDAVQNKGYVRELVKTTLLVESGGIHDAATNLRYPVVIESVDGVAQFASDTTVPDNARVVQNVVDEDGNLTQVVLPTNGPRNRTLTYREAGDKVGVRAEFMPYVALESMELDINVDVSSVTGYTPNGNPMISSRHLGSYVRLVDGEPFVLGGIERENVVRRKNGVPFLHSLPVVGWLFGAETNVKTKTQIVMVVTPHFILGTESAREMPEEMRTIVSQAKGETSEKLPPVEFGFDQWLMD